MHGKFVSKTFLGTFFGHSYHSNGNKTCPDAACEVTLYKVWEQCTKTLLSWFLNKMFCQLTLLVTGPLHSKNEEVALTFVCSTLCVMISTCSDNVEFIIYSKRFCTDSNLYI